jgi:hypothetical protein
MSHVPYKSSEPAAQSGHKTVRTPAKRQGSSDVLVLAQNERDGQLKLLPHPQVFVAFGLLMLNPAPWRPSL